MNAAGIVTLAVLLALVLFAPRRWALLGLLGGVLYLTLGQSINVAGLNIYPIRVLALGAFARVIARGEWSFAAMNDIDRALLILFGYRTVVFLLNSNGSTTIALGVFVDVTLSYFAWRGLLAGFNDLKWLLRGLVLLLVPYVALLYVESSTARNPFVALGGLEVFEMRRGRPRAMGSFAHALTLGTFGASFIPPFVALCLMRKWRVWGAGGLLLCVAIVYFTNSSTPAVCTVLALIGWLLWFLRTRMAAVRLAVLGGIVALAVAMKAPLWFLPAKISELIGGGDGWHRSYLVDVALQHLGEWWLVGMPVTATRDWFPYIVVTGGADLINYYLDFGISAGIVASGLFVFLLVRAFSRLGRALRAEAAATPATHDRSFLLWALGVTLGIHVFTWFGLVYFDQYQVVFLMQLAAISTLSQRSMRAYTERLQARPRDRPLRPAAQRLAPPSR